MNSFEITELDQVMQQENMLGRAERQALRREHHLPSRRTGIADLLRQRRPFNAAFAWRSR